MLITNLRQELMFYNFLISLDRVAKSWNSLPLNVRKTESLNVFKDRPKSFLRLRDISTFSKFIFFTSLIIFLV